jgi:hypothetical protein
MRVDDIVIHYPVYKIGSSIYINIKKIVKNKKSSKANFWSSKAISSECLLLSILTFNWLQVQSEPGDCGII